jgi:predicted P-loop ATPase
MTALAGALREGQTLPGVTRLIVFADRDDAGQKAAAELRDAAISAGLAAEARLPRGGDDFNGDLIKGLGGEPVIMPAAPQPPSAETLMAQARSLGRNPELADLKQLFLTIASTPLETLAVDRLLDTIRAQTKMKASSVAKCLKDARVELGLDILGSGSVGGNWLGKLRTSDAGNPKAVVANAITALREAPEWRDILWFDEFRQQVVLRGKAPWMGYATEVDWTDNFDTKTAAWLQGHDIDVTPSAVTPAVDDIARENTFHPVREYLESLVSDGRKLLDIWLTYFLGVEPDPIDGTLAGEDRERDQQRYNAQAAYIRAVGRAWLISAVARVFQPGCKADCALILEGPQGKKKSMVFRKLGSPWFADELAEFGSKDAAIQILGVWIIELAELSTLRRSDRNRAKSFMSREQDHYVPKYGRRWIDQPRQCVFAGTSNDSEYLNDPTGGRRWWPVKCGKIDIEALELCRDQLWAEAVAAYRAGEIWWLEDESLIAIAQQEQSARAVTDVWDERILRFLGEQTSKAQTANQQVFVTRANVLHEIGIPDKDQTQIHANRVADILVRFGWERFQIGKGSLRRTWAYRPKKTDKTENNDEVR